MESNRSRSMYWYDIWVPRPIILRGRYFGSLIDTCYEVRWNELTSMGTSCPVKFITLCLDFISSGWFYWSTLLLQESTVFVLGSGLVLIVLIRYTFFRLIVFTVSEVSSTFSFTHCILYLRVSKPFSRDHVNRS